MESERLLSLWRRSQRPSFSGRFNFNAMFHLHSSPCLSGPVLSQEEVLSYALHRLAAECLTHAPLMNAMFPALSSGAALFALHAAVRAICSSGMPYCCCLLASLGIPGRSPFVGFMLAAVTAPPWVKRNHVLPMQADLATGARTLNVISAFEWLTWGKGFGTVP